MVNVNMLKGKIVEKGYSVAGVAPAIGMSKITLYRKLKKGGGDLLIKEVAAMSTVLHLTGDEVNKIFFTESRTERNKN